MNRSVHTLLPLCLLFACAEVPDGLMPTDDHSAARSIEEGSAEALGMLAFLNDPSTTFELLDGPVGLDRRAATSITAHRDGPDGVVGTSDDNLFQTLEEVDSCWYVGESALTHIADWAALEGWIVSDPDADLGTWDGVSFTYGEAEATLQLVNTATESHLDDDLALDRRAVDSIVAERPVGTVEQLASLYYVGTSALTALKQAATANDCTQPGWHSDLIRADDTGLWRDQLPADLLATIDDMLATDDWCGEAYGAPWFSQATVDYEDCAYRSAGVTLYQMVDPFHGIQFTIDFQIDAELDYDPPDCQI